MTRLVRALRCFVGWHRPDPGVDPEWSLYWHCRDCPAVVLGRLGKNVKRWQR